ncbi:unnamed protein product, partial [marine sediment metagenome]
GLANLYGIVTDAKTDKPVGGVSVSFHGRIAHSNPAGYYIFTDLEPRYYTAMWFEKEGYETTIEFGITLVEGNNELNIQITPSPPTPTETTFTVRIINAEILDQNALAAFGLPTYSCVICVVDVGWMEGEGGELIPYPIFWETTDYAAYVTHMQSVHPGVAIWEERPQERGRWGPRIPGGLIPGVSWISPEDGDWIGEPGLITSTVSLTVPAFKPGTTQPAYWWIPEYPWVHIEINGGPYIARPPTYGPLNQPYGTPVELHQGAL